MSEELTQAAEPVEQAVVPAHQAALTMWNDAKLMNLAYRTAGMLSKSALVPDNYRNSPENCLIAIDMANRMNLSPMFLMQNLYIVRGKPAWSGSFCAAAINGCGKFTPLEYVFVGEPGTPTEGCFARATRTANGAQCVSETITMKMAKDEGWLDKRDSKWKTMPRQMMMYRAASFFARAHCPEVLLGIQTAEEVQDVRGYDEPAEQVTTVVLEGGAADA
uniref:RecT protein n=1 Tax=Siphoviridae sp. ctvok7 TaxID=2827596 RepID=A0A8S5LLW7_9CAUD|nr:MAG TPA: RecT protein [Siphoviridae sp. ctvok7]